MNRLRFYFSKFPFLWAFIQAGNWKLFWYELTLTYREWNNVNEEFNKSVDKVFGK